MAESDYVTIKDSTNIWQKPAPTSVISIGDIHYKTSLPVDQRFNWFQKFMWKVCFGVKVEDYKEEYENGKREEM